MASNNRPANSPMTEPSSGWTHPLTKQGYLGSPLVETTPISLHGELYLLENWRDRWDIRDTPAATTRQRSEVWMAHLPDGPEHYDRRHYVSCVMTDATLGSALVWDNTAYVFAADAQDSTGGQVLWMSSSDDMQTWSAPAKVFDSPFGEIFNVAVTRDDRSMVFLWETNARGVPFTMCMGRVEHPLDNWNEGILDGAVYGENKYTGGPALYYEAGWYYLLYLEALGGGRYETHITRSRDLMDWIDAPDSRPFLTFDPNKDSMPLQLPAVTETNASDAELCFHHERTLVFFTGGNQLVAGDLQWASYDGTPKQLLENFFARA